MGVGTILERLGRQCGDFMNQQFEKSLLIYEFTLLDFRGKSSFCSVLLEYLCCFGVQYFGKIDF